MSFLVEQSIGKQGIRLGLSLEIELDESGVEVDHLEGRPDVLEDAPDHLVVRL